LNTRLAFSRASSEDVPKVKNAALFRPSELRRTSALVSLPTRATLDLFVSIYGAEAGNLALKTMATAGVYIGGGIAPKIISEAQESRIYDSVRGEGQNETLARSDRGASDPQ